MSTFAADDANAIAKRLKEIEAEKVLRVTGEKLPEVVGDYVPQGWPYGMAADYDPA